MSTKVGTQPLPQAAQLVSPCSACSVPRTRQQTRCLGYFTLHLRDTSRLKLSIQGGSQNAWVWLPCLNRYGVVFRLILVPHSSQRLLAGTGVLLCLPAGIHNVD